MNWVKNNDLMKFALTAVGLIAAATIRSAITRWWVDRSKANEDWQNWKD
jgi:hypothetical protein